MNQEQLQAIRERSEHAKKVFSLTKDYELELNLLDEIERLRGALEYYGNRDTYETPVDSALGGTTLEILKDHGKRARQALAGEPT